MRIDLDVYGDVQLSRELLRVGEHAGDLRPVLRALADEWRDIELEQFASGGQSGSGGWDDLQESTIKRKRASSNPTVVANAERVLLATERLFESFTEHNADHIEHVERDELTFGSSVPYARYHQKGEGVPQRRPVELTGTERRSAVRRLQTFVMTGRVH